MTGLGFTLVTHSNKAVAVGAVSFHVDRFVTGRISKFTYGTSHSIAYEPSNLEHVKRAYKSYLDPSGQKYIPDHFKSMLLRVRHSLPPIDPLWKFHHITGY